MHESRLANGLSMNHMMQQGDPGERLEKDDVPVGSKEKIGSQTAGQ
jgi:hypothetical protein